MYKMQLKMPLKARPELPVVINSWKPPIGARGLKAAGAVGLLLGIEGFLAMQLFARAFDFGSFLVIFLAFLVACLMAIQGYSLYCLHNLTYVLGSESLAIQCGALRYVLPLGSIVDVVPLKTSAQRMVVTRPLALGFPDRSATLDGIGEVHLIATTTEPSALALVSTADASFAVSPSNRDGFVDRLNVRRSRPEVQASSIEVKMPRVASLSFWRDRAALGLLAAGFVGNLVLLAYVSYKFPALPPLLPLHYNSLGEIDFIGTRAEAFKIPLIGTAAVLADLVIGAAIHTREKIVSYIVLSTAIVVQVILLVAIVKIVY